VKAERYLITKVGMTGESKKGGIKESIEKKLERGGNREEWKG